jgi:ubiquinone/menaquinone biosynthesis C-methylase UbiE
MINEAEYYENPDIWDVNKFGDADQQRFATLGDKLPIDVRTLLDVGCGNGLFLKHVSNMTGRNMERLCGTDRSEAALAHVQLEKVKADVACLPFKDYAFDAVSCMEILEHLPQTTFVSALNDLSRVASRYILVSVPFNLI